MSSAAEVLSPQEERIEDGKQIGLVNEDAQRGRLHPHRDPFIGDEAADRLFESFYTTKDDGLGIGLSICHSIIDDHGGQLWAESNDRGGATFRFTVGVAK